MVHCKLNIAYCELRGRFSKISNLQFAICNASGQALVEYLLIATVLLAALWGTSALFQRAFPAAFERLARIVASPVP